MATPMPDPDAFIRERLFQRIVDRVGIDPQNAAKTIFRFHLIGMITGIAIMCACAMLPPSETGLTQSQPFGMVAMMLIDSALVGISVHTAPYSSITPGMALMRISMTFVAVILTCAMVEAWIRSVHPIVTVCTTVVTISWALGPIACYLHICRQPPPRRSDTATDRSKTIRV